MFAPFIRVIPRLCAGQVHEQVMGGSWGFRVAGKVWGRNLVHVTRPAPLMGSVFIGVIDRGTNVLQVRPTTLCNLSCIFCSVDAGPTSRWRQSEYVVIDYEWLAVWVEEVARFKGVRVETLIDGVGEPTTYPYLVELVETLKSSPWVETVALETHGQSLTVELIRRLEEAGLDRINLSLDTLNPEKGRFLSGTRWYDVERVRRIAEFVARETSIDLHVTPVWIPGVNDEDVVEVVRWALEIGAGKRWPPVTIQKYLEHRHGRRVRGVKELPWRLFWRRLEELERELGVKLRPSMEEWGMRRARKVPEIYRIGEVVEVEVVAPGWLKGEALAVTLDGKRMVTLVSRRERLEVGMRLEARVKSNRDNIYVAAPL